MQLWTYEHFITLVPSIIVMVLITFLLSILIGKKDIKIRRIPLMIISVLLVILEIIKQVKSLIDGYNLYYIPLHFCSLFIFMLPLMAFYRGKKENGINEVTCAICISLGLFMLIYPNLIYSADNIKNFFKTFDSFHTVSFHTLALFAYILIIGLNLHTHSKKENKLVILFGIGYSVIAASMSQILKVNFSNFYVCNVGPIENIRHTLQESIGYVPTQILYVVLLLILHVLFILMSYYLYIGISKLKNKIKLKCFNKSKSL